MKLIDKAAVVAEIKRISCENPMDNSWYVDTEELLNFINTFEVKEVNLNEEIEKCLKRHNMLAVGKKDFTDIAKHFFELGLKYKSSYISISNIDDTLKEMGVDPDSKIVKTFKESYYMALEKLKEKKGM